MMEPAAGCNAAVNGIKCFPYISNSLESEPAVAVVPVWPCVHYPLLVL